ncbi:hypothetical protein PGT21_013333 [Puccinia graminis f. sp. tritici]|uniref:Uncharacterized protein n=1 Tax=Puccinia graminis f. sp. tritici TaxID=56615 RepID=A0A5B0QW53_PUCGR|nr:hypothetical protein PGT21_013333 [Puccinia graminis f. sp. tritici]
MTPTLGRRPMPLVRQHGEPSSPEAHHQSPIAASSEAGDSERTASQPPSAASDSRPAEDGHSEGAAL